MALAEKKSEFLIMARRQRTAWAAVALRDAGRRRRFLDGANRQRRTVPILTKVARFEISPRMRQTGSTAIRFQGVITYHIAGIPGHILPGRLCRNILWNPHPHSRLDVGSLVSVEGNTTPGDFAPSIEKRQDPLSGPHGSATRAAQVSGQSIDRGRRQPVGEGPGHCTLGDDRRPLAPGWAAGAASIGFGIASGSNQFKARIRQFEGGADYHKSD